METFDYVIVGAGSAGCVLANRLSEDPNTSVCVLEAGPRDWHPYIHLPAGFIKTFHMRSVNWAYQQEPGPWTGGRSIYAPRGKTLGGSSSINGHIYNRGQRQDFDTWAQLGNRGWGYPDVLPYFRRLERRIGEGEDTYRGRDGSLIVTNEFTFGLYAPLNQRHDEHESANGQQRLGAPQISDLHGHRFGPSDDSSFVQPDERQKQTDADRKAVFQARRDRVGQPTAQSGECDHQK